MRRTTIALLAALDAVVTAFVSYGIALVPLMLLWALHFGLAIDLGVFFRAAGGVWLLGHGVDLTVQLDPVTAGRTGVAGAGRPFTITLALLGFALLTVLAGRRIGRRAAFAESRLVGGLTAVIVFGAIGFTIALVSRSAAASAPLWQAALLPAVVMAAGVVLGLVTDGGVDELLGSRRMAGLVDRVPAVFVESARRALRIGVGAVFGLFAASAAVLTVLIATHYATIAGLHQALGAGVGGGIAITVAELALLPVTVVWTASWLLGPGFALGAGTHVSPAGTLLGPVPGVPLLGVLPADPSPLAGLAVLVPLAFGVAGGLLVGREEVPEMRWRWWVPLATGLGAGATAGAVMGLAAWWSSGAVGPGRLAQVGPDGWLVGLTCAAAVGAGAVIGGYLAKRGEPEASDAFGASGRAGATD